MAHTTFYFQSVRNARTLHAIRRFNCGHYYIQTYIKGNPLLARRVKVPASVMDEMRTEGKLLNVVVK